MKLRDVLTVSGVAMVTAAGVFGAWALMPNVGAEDKPEAKQPALEVNGAKLKVNLVEGKDGKTDVVLRVVAGSDAGVNTKCTVNMLHQDMSSVVSRMPAGPTQTWNQTVDVVVGPGESKDFVVKSDVDLALAGFYTFNLQHGKQAIVAASAAGKGTGGATARSQLSGRQGATQVNWPADVVVLKSASQEG